MCVHISRHCSSHLAEPLTWDVDHLKVEATTCMQFTERSLCLKQPQGQASLSLQERSWSCNVTAGALLSTIAPSLCLTSGAILAWGSDTLDLFEDVPSSKARVEDAGS